MEKEFEEIQKLLEQHRYDEAGHTFSKLIAEEEFAREEALMTYLAVMAAYFEVLEASRAEYLDALDTGVALLRDTASKQREMSNGIDIARVNHEIKTIQEGVGS